MLHSIIFRGHAKGKYLSTISVHLRISLYKWKRKGTRTTTMWSLETKVMCGPTFWSMTSNDNSEVQEEFTLYTKQPDAWHHQVPHPAPPLSSSRRAVTVAWTTKALYGIPLKKRYSTEYRPSLSKALQRSDAVDNYKSKLEAYLTTGAFEIRNYCNQWILNYYTMCAPWASSGRTRLRVINVHIIITCRKMG